VATEFADSTKKSYKKLSEHQINQSERKVSQKTVCLVPLKCIGAKSSYWGSRRNAPESSNVPGLKLSSKNLNLKRKCIG
jgi:hypothetical protein